MATSKSKAVGLYSNVSCLNQWTCRSINSSPPWAWVPCTPSPRAWLSRSGSRGPHHRPCPPPRPRVRPSQARRVPGRGLPPQLQVQHPTTPPCACWAASPLRHSQARGAPKARALPSSTTQETRLPCKRFSQWKKIIVEQVIFFQFKTQVVTNLMDHLTKSFSWDYTSHLPLRMLRTTATRNWKRSLLITATSSITSHTKTTCRITRKPNWPWRPVSLPSQGQHTSWFPGMIMDKSCHFWTF